MLVEIRNELQRHYVSIYKQEQEHLDTSLLLSKLVSVIYCLIKIPSGCRQSQNVTWKEFVIFRWEMNAKKERKRDGSKTKSNSKRVNNQ
jgi:hypothetical protein